MLGRRMPSARSRCPRAVTLWEERQRSRENCPRGPEPFGDFPLLRGQAEFLPATHEGGRVRSAPRAAPQPLPGTPCPQRSSHAGRLSQSLGFPEPTPAVGPPWAPRPHPTAPHGGGLLGRYVPSPPPSPTTPVTSVSPAATNATGATPPVSGDRAMDQEGLASGRQGLVLFTWDLPARCKAPVEQVSREHEAASPMSLHVPLRPAIHTDLE